jgi:hypothetical protein
MAVAIGAAIAHAAAQASPATGAVFALDRQELIFGTLVAGRQPGVTTPPQRLFVEALGQPSLPWTAVADRSWLEVQPARGKIPARLTIGVRPSAMADPLRDDEGHVVVTVDHGGVSSQQTIRVGLRVLREPRPPVGSFDSPGDGTVVTGVVRLFGWALHDVGLSGVAICRDHVARSPRSDVCGDLTPIGDAEVYYNARPDVALVVRTQPFRERSGWTYVLDPRSLGKGARGGVRVFAVARGIDGSRSVIGVRTMTVVPDQDSWFRLSPRTWRILGVLCAGLVLHWLLRWFCLTRLPDAAVAAAGAEPPITLLELAGIGSIVALSFAMNLRALTSSLTYDELYTASHYAVGVPLWTAAFNVSTFTNHIAYSLLAALSVRILGASEFALRFPAAILGALAIVAVWRYARAWAGRGTALAGALIFALLPFHAHWSRMARGYTGMALMTVLAVHGFSTVVRKGSTRAAVEHAGALVLAVYFHLYAGWVFLVQYGLFAVLSLTSAWRRGAGGSLTRRSFRLLWLSFLCAGALVLILYVPVANGFLNALPLFAERASVRGGLFVDVFSAFAGTESIAVRIGIGALVACGAAFLWRRSRLDAVHLAVLLIVPIALVVLILRPRVELERYFGFGSPVFALFLAAGLSSLAGWPAAVGPSTVLRRAGAAIAGVLLILLSVDWIRHDALAGPRGGYGELLETLNDPPRPPVFAIGADSEMFQFYVHRWRGTLQSVQELEQVLLFSPPFRVAYHDVDWDSPEQRQMRAILQPRCKRTDHGTVLIFECGE